MVSRIKLQIIGCFRKRQTWKQNKGEQKTLTNVVWDPRRNGWLKTMENDLKRLRKMMQQSLTINQSKSNLQQRTYTNDTHILSKLSEKVTENQWK